MVAAERGAPITKRHGCNERRPVRLRRHPQRDGPGREEGPRLIRDRRVSGPAAELHRMKECVRFLLRSSLLALLFIPAPALAQSGVLIPSGADRPDPRVLSLDEMSVN